MPADTLDRPQPCPSCSTYLLLHKILRLLAADACEVIITTENVGTAVRAAGRLLRAFIEPDMGEP
jgi:hypothetical protein